LLSLLLLLQSFVAMVSSHSLSHPEQCVLAAACCLPGISGFVYRVSI
jgi:hypothetical protein